MKSFFCKKKIGEQMFKIKINLREMIFMISMVVILSGFIFAKSGGITDEITEDLTTNVAQTVEEGFNGALEKMAGAFNPSLNLFYNLTSGNAANESLFDESNAKNFTVGGESGMMKLFRNFANYTGITLATIIWGYSLIFYMFTGKLTDSKDNPIRCTLLFIVSLLMIYMSQEIMNYFLEVVQGIWSYVVDQSNQIDNTATRGAFLASNFYKIFGVSSLTGILTQGSIAIFGIAPVVHTGIIVVCLLLIIGIFILWLLFKGFLRLWLEMAERYIIVCLMVFLFPAVCPFVISKDTVVVFKSYIRMLCSQLFLIVCGFVFVKGFSILIGGLVHTTIIGFIFCMGYLRTAQRIDSYMASMGLNVAQTGGGLFDSFALAVHSMGATVRGANGLRKGAGNAMKASAIGTQNKELFKAGARIGSSISDVGKMASVGGLKNLGKDAHFLAEAGKAGQKLGKGAVSPQVANEAVSKFMKNPTSENKHAINALHRDDLKSALNANKAMPNGTTIDKVVPKSDGTFAVEGTTKDGLGVKGIISSEPMNKNTLETGFGNQDTYFTPQNTADKGEIFEINGKGDLEQALVSTGNGAAIGNENIKTMDDYNEAVETGNEDAQKELTHGGMTEALHKADFGTQCLTGDNCEYGAGIPTALITPDGDYLPYQRANSDMAVSTSEMSQAEKDNKFYGANYKDSIGYEPGSEPTVTEAMKNIPQSIKDEIGYKEGMELKEANGGFGVKANFIKEPNDDSYLNLSYGRYNFSKSQLNGAYGDWNVAENATPHKESYGKESIQVVNAQTGESAKMVLSNVAVHGYGRSSDKILTTDTGDVYSASIVREKVKREVKTEKSEEKKPQDKKTKKKVNNNNGKNPNK